MPKENITKRKLKNEPRFKLQLNEEQKQVVTDFYEFDVNFIHGDFGCFEKNTPVRMYDGFVKYVQDINIGDKLMGRDSKPRTVLKLNRGRDKMYKISQKKGGLSYTVNSKHILALSKYYKPSYFREYIDNERVTDYSKIITPSRREEVNITVEDFLKIPFREVNYQGYISEPIKYPHKELPIDPYYLGLWLGDGTKVDIKSITTTDIEIIEYLNSLSNNIKVKDSITYTVKDTSLNENFKELYDLKNIEKLYEKYIPTIYLNNSIENRKQLLAGIIDADGSLRKFNYEIIQKNKKLSYDIYYLIRSLGYNAYIRIKNATMKRIDGSIYECPVYRISFSITEDNTIPCKVDRKTVKDFKRNDGRNPKYNGLTIKELEEDNYYGFTVDGDNMFLLEDYTVVHNCGKTMVSCYIALSAFRKKQFNKIVIARPIVKNSVGYLPGDISEKLDPYVAPIVHNFNMLQATTTTDKMMDNKDIEILPIDFAKGITYTNSVVIIDEYEDLNYEDFRMMLSRLGKDSKIIFCGSKEQIHRSINKHSCIFETIKLKESGIVGYNTLKSNHRNEAIENVLNYLEK